MDLDYRDMSGEALRALKEHGKGPVIRREAAAELNRRAAFDGLLKAAERALPWIGKLIADGGHLNSVAPNDAVGAMDELAAAITKAGGKT